VDSVDKRIRNSMSLKSTKRFIPVAGVLLVGSILLTGCTSDTEQTEAPKVPAVAVQDEKTQVDAPELSFGSSAEITQPPTWATAESIPEQWKQFEIDDAAREDAERQGYEITIQPFFNTDETAEVYTEVGYVPTTSTSRGELYLSQDYLYGSLDGFGSKLTFSEPQVVSIKTSTGTVDAFGVYFEGKDLPPFSGDVKGFKVVRVFDTQVETGQTPPPVDPSIDPSLVPDPTKGLPALSVTYIAQADAFKTIEEDGSPLQLFVADIK
jgi:hypothetical protein